MLRQLAQPTPQRARAGTAVQTQQAAPLARLGAVSSGNREVHMLWLAGLDAAGPAPDRFAAPLHVVLGLADWIPAAIRDTLVP